LERNFDKYMWLYDVFTEDKNSFKMPTNLFRRTFLYIFFPSNNFLLKQPNLIGEVIEVYRLSYSLLIDKKILREESNVILSENLKENVTIDNTFTSLFFEIKG